MAKTTSQLAFQPLHVIALISPTINICDFACHEVHDDN